jgi:hypothetical protein
MRKRSRVTLAGNMKGNCGLHLAVRRPKAVEAGGNCKSDRQRRL